MGDKEVQKSASEVLARSLLKGNERLWCDVVRLSTIRMTTTQSHREYRCLNYIKINLKSHTQLVCITGLS